MAEMGDDRRGSAIGIDLGTSCSCVGVWRRGRVEIIPNEQGCRTTPSYVAFTDTERLVGDAAKNQVALNPTNTVFGTKRFIGKTFSAASVQTDMTLWPFKVIAGRGDKLLIAVRHKGVEKLLAAEEVASMVVAKLKANAEAYLGGPVTDAVITVPASFDDSQRHATEDACAIAGLNVMRVIHEPKAAAIAYALDAGTGEKNVLVFDLGAGNVSVSLLTIMGDVITVGATAGDPHLGGEDFNSRMVEHFLEQFRREHKKDASGNARALVRLRTACEHAKRTLSSASQAAIEIDSFYEGIDFYTTITRDRFEELNMDLFWKCMKPAEKCLRDAKIERNRVNDVVLIGGSNRIPCVRRILRDLFDGKELRESINPDEAAACGATIQAAILSRERDKKLLHLLLLDAIERSLGVESTGGAMTVVIPKNYAIPIRNTQIISLKYSDENKGVVVSVFQGERYRARDNDLLCELKLHVKPEQQEGKIPISVRFDVDCNGVLTVSATHKATGQKRKIKITKGNAGPQRKEEMKRMARDAKRYRAEDEANKKRVEARSLLEGYVYSARRAIEAEAKKVGDALLAVDKVIEWMDDNQLADDGKLQELLGEVRSIEHACSPAPRSTAGRGLNPGILKFM